jgi:hypothetical protein
MLFGEDRRLPKLQQRQPSSLLERHSARLLVLDEQRQMVADLLVELAIAACPCHGRVQA